MNVREKAVRFGKSTSLIGVLSEPATPAPGAPAVLLLNSGILHRVGACRLYVQLARAIAALGYTVLRFDYSGIGDSEARKDALSFEESATIETREAMDWLGATKGAQRFVLLGLCSGADMAHETARLDERVVGLGMLDPYAYRTRGYWLRHYGRRATKLSYWRRFVTIRARRLLRLDRVAQTEGADGVTFDVPKYVRVFPPRERVADDLRRFVARDVRMLAFFSGGLGEDYNHRGQYVASFPDVAFGRTLREEFLLEADHIFTDLGHQREVVGTFREWMGQFGGVARESPASAMIGLPAGDGTLEPLRRS